MQPSVRVKVSQISGREDAVAQHLLGILGPFVVTLHHAGGCGNQDFPVVGDGDRIVRADFHGIGIPAYGDCNARTGLRESVAKAQTDSLCLDRLQQLRRAVSGAYQNQPQFFVEAVLLQEKAQKPRYQGNRCRPVEPEIVEIVSGPAAKRHGCPAAQAPQKPADKSEHMPQRQHAHQAVLRLQRKLLRSVIGALAETGIRQYHCLGPFCRSGGEKQDFPRAVSHTVGQVSLQFPTELRISP